MIVSDTEKFVFIHNPKCGGMSCHNALLKYDTRNNVFFEWKPIGPAGNILDMAHVTPSQMRKFFPKAFAEVESYVKFAFVRNPYDRFMSAVSQHLKLGTPYMRQAILSDPDTFYRVAARFALTALKHEQVQNDHKLVHFRPQLRFVNIDGHRWADLIFHLENPHEMQGTPVAIWLSDMRDANQTFDGQGYDPHRLGAEALARLGEFYAEDFESFGYERIHLA